MIYTVTTKEFRICHRQATNYLTLNKPLSIESIAWVRLIGKRSWTTTIGHEFKYKIQENLLRRLCEIEETGNRETIIDQWLHGIHRSQTNHFEKWRINRNDNNEERKINMPTSKLHKGEHKVESILELGRIEKPQNNIQNWNEIPKTDTNIEDH